MLHVGPRDRLDAAGHGIGDDQQPDQERGEPRGPAEDDRQGNRGSVERYARRQTAFDEKDAADQRARLGVEALLQVLVRGVHFGAVKNRDRGGGQDDHRERESEIELHEPHAVDVGLAGGRNESHCARLGRHDGQSHGIPGHGPSGEHVLIRCSAAPAAIESVADDERQPTEHDHPIERPHAEKIRPKQ